MEVFDRRRCGWATEDVDSEVKMGERIARLINEKIMTPDVAEVEDLDLTLRREGGFGSTRCKAHVLGFGCNSVLRKFVFSGDEVVPGMHAGLVLLSLDRQDYVHAQIQKISPLVFDADPSKEKKKPKEGESIVEEVPADILSFLELRWI